MAYHGATYPKVRRWLSFFQGKRQIEKEWILSFQEMLQTIELPRSGKLSKETILDAEKAIHQEKILLIRSLMRYEPGKSRAVFQAYLRRYEIKNLMNLVLSLVYHRPIVVLYELGQGYRLQSPFVDGMKDLKELQSFLIHTPYYRLAQHVFPELERTGETFSFEIQLYNLFLEEMNQAAKQSGEWRAWRETLLFGLEMERLLFVARMKFGYKRATEEVLAYFPPIFEEKQYWRRLLKTKTLQEFLGLLPSSLRLRGVEDVQRLSSILPQRVMEILWPFTRAMGSARFLGAFLVIMEFMTQNLQIVLEAKRYKLSWDRVSQFIVDGGSHVVF